MRAAFGSILICVAVSISVHADPLTIRTPLFASASAVVVHKRPMLFTPVTAFLQTSTVNRASNLFSNGTTNMLFGAEGSAGGELSGGSVPYAGVLSVSSANALQFGTSNLVRMTLTPTGNVGIGTANPQALLDVSGASSTSDFRISRSSDPTAYLSMTAPGGTPNTSTFGISGRNIISLNVNGNVGIGTVTPGQPLSVAGVIESTTGGIKFPDGTVQTTASGGGLSPWTTAGTTLNYAGGNVGIGTPSPTYRLDVTGAGHVSSNFMVGDVNNGPLLLVAPSSARYVTPSIGVEGQGGAVSLGAYGANAVFLGTNGVERLFVTGAGNVGIGTTAPVVPLDVRCSGNCMGLRVGNSAGGNGGGTIAWYGNGTKVWAWGQDINGAYMLNVTDSIFGLTTLNNGNVGVGVTAPAAKLHVAGNILADGTVTARYQDVAEWVDAPDPLEPGTVVIVDPAAPNRVVAAPRAYDTRVAGAVSQTPGLILGTEGDRKSMVAQSGRVRVKVDASYGPIAIGDLLVTSPTPGYAMRSKPLSVDGEEMHRPGTLLGKALEALPSGRGEILVLLTLQ
jgi:hypothetical protein